MNSVVITEILLLICILLCVVSGVLFAYYYKEYVAPESFTIGSITTGTYKELEIKEYLAVVYKE